MLLYLLSPHLEGRGEQPVVDGPGLAGGHDPPYPDVTRERLEALVRALDQALLVGLLRHSDQRQERPALAYQDGLLEGLVPEYRKLHVLRRQLLAVGENEHVLEAPADEDPAVLDLGEIPGVQPGVAVERLRGRLRVVPISLHDAWAAREQLAGLGDAHLDVVERLAHGLR